MNEMKLEALTINQQNSEYVEFEYVITYKRMPRTGIAKVKKARFFNKRLGYDNRLMISDLVYKGIDGMVRGIKSGTWNQY